MNGMVTVLSFKIARKNYYTVVDIMPYIQNFPNIKFFLLEDDF